MPITPDAMVYYAGALCISASALVESGIMSESGYKALAHRGRLSVLRRGGGAKGQCALLFSATG